MAGEGTLDTSDAVKFQLPNTFCLEPLDPIAGCNTPAGISAIVYDINPTVKIHIS